MNPVTYVLIYRFTKLRNQENVVSKRMIYRTYYVQTKSLNFKGHTVIRKNIYILFRFDFYVVHKSLKSIFVNI